MELSEIGEYGLINRLKHMLSTNRNVIKSIGDDCAVLHSNRSGWYELFAIDTIVEGIHFTREDSPYLVGRKAVAVNISDIASMGGLPSFVVVSLAIPPSIDLCFITRLYDGMNTIAEDHRVSIVGGDTVHTKGPLVLTVAITGSVEKKCLTLRSGAKSGDRIYVTGKLGGSIHGKHLKFTPRFKEARYLVKNFKPTAMIDISDGLSSDITRILEESHAGAVIHAMRIPVSTIARRGDIGVKRTPLEKALMDGEDFELLFTLPAEKAPLLERKWKSGFEVRLTCIGEITKGSKLILKHKDGKEELITDAGYNHFR